MELSNWECILMYLYEGQGSYGMAVLITDGESSEKSAEQRHKEGLVNNLQQEVNWSGETPGTTEISNILENMENAGLLEMEYTEKIGEIKLSQEGFTVAHDVRMNQTQAGQNRELIYLTAFLAVSAIINAVATMANPALNGASIFRIDVDVILGVLAVSLFVGIAWEYYHELV